MTDEGTDPINEGGSPEPTPAPIAPSRFGFFGRLVGNPIIFDRLEILMARLDAITTALGNISTQLTQLSTQIADLQAGSVSQEEIDAVAAQAQAIADAVDAAIEPDAGEGTPEEPPVV